MALSRSMLLLLFGLATLSIASTIPRDGPYGGGGGGGGPGSGSGSGSSSGGSSSSSSSSGAGAGAGESSELAELLYLFHIAEVHGTMMCLAFGFVFPMGGILIRTLPGRSTVWLHAAWQSTGWLMTLAGMGMGIWMARTIGYIDLAHLQYHVAIGLVAVSGVCLQPLTGWIHHRMFKRTGGRTGWSYAHMGWGIAVVTLGAINGEFGLMLALQPRKYMILYGVLAAAVWVTWMIVSVISQCRRRGRPGRSRTKKMEDPQSSGGAGAEQESPRRERRKERRLRGEAKAVRRDSS